ncbi:MAG: ATP synthase subunit I [Methylococcaceae bacterium]|nr:MAG: ATP synthase subunit I [Methylococcaceae bacterium]
MPEALLFTLPLLAGVMLGAFFYGGLWWTIQRGLRADQPVLWFLPSLIIRNGITVLGFYGVSGDDWRRWLLCLAGFLAARLMIGRFQAE